MNLLIQWQQKQQNNTEYDKRRNKKIRDGTVGNS
jgi:ribosome-associated protein YbcJ (S4-like RNA binding protein)